MNAFRRIASLVLWLGAAGAGLGQCYNWSTAAGPLGFWGADGTNAAAGFYSPFGVSVDAKGCLFVADTVDNTIRKIQPVDTSWVTTTIAGSRTPGYADGTNGSARFRDPMAVAFDAVGNVYVADSDNGRIRKIVPVGTNWVVTTWPGLSNSFDSPYGIAIDASTNVYVAEFHARQIVKVSPAGTNWVVRTIAGSGLQGNADGTNTTSQFWGPGAIALDRAGSIYVPDALGYTIRRIAPIGTNWVVTTLAGLGSRSGSADGTNSDARFGLPAAVAVDSAGNLYVGDYGNNTIRKIKPEGTNWVVTTIGGLAGAAGGRVAGVGQSARFSQPAGVAVDTAGNLFVADVYDNAIRFGQPGFCLDIALSSGGVILSWPVTATNYLLETATALPDSPWMTLTGGVTVSGDSFIFTTNAASPAAFFRLHQP